MHQKEYFEEEGHWGQLASLECCPPLDSSYWVLGSWASLNSQFIYSISTFVQFYFLAPISELLANAVLICLVLFIILFFQGKKEQFLPDRIYRLYVKIFASVWALLQESFIKSITPAGKYYHVFMTKSCCSKH